MSGLDLEISAPQLRCFIAVASAGSIAGAARRLGVSPASVSKAIRRLEQGAGVMLLHRSTHALSLTEAGQALLEPAHTAVCAAEAFADAAAQAGEAGAAGAVRITGPVGLVRHVVAPLAVELARLHPDIRLDVRATNEIVDLAEAGVDLALRSGPLEGLPGHLRQRWFSSPWVICAAPAYLERQGAPGSIEELADHTLIGFRNQRTGRVQAWPHRLASGEFGGQYEPQARLSFDDGEACWVAVLQGAGLGCAPLFLAADALRRGGAVEVLRDWRDAEVVVSLVRRERRLTPARVAAVIAFLAARAPDLADLI